MLEKMQCWSPTSDSAPNPDITGANRTKIQNSNELAKISHIAICFAVGVSCFCSICCYKNMYSFELLKILDHIPSAVSFCFQEYISQYRTVCKSSLWMSNASFRILIRISYLDRTALSWDHNQTSKVSMNFLDQEKCSAKCHSDILAQKPPPKIIGEEGQHEPNLPAVCSWKAPFLIVPLQENCIWKAYLQSTQCKHHKEEFN